MTGEGIEPIAVHTLRCLHAPAAAQRFGRLAAAHPSAGALDLDGVPLRTGDGPCGSTCHVCTPAAPGVRINVRSTMTGERGRHLATKKQRTKSVQWGNLAHSPDPNLCEGVV